MANSAPVTAAILVVGDEILSGRTKDKNIGYIAEYLTAMGIDVREVRVVPDVADEIVTALNAIRVRYDYVFTTGGIGPTHDDITADCVARAFEVPIDVRQDAVDLMLARYQTEDLTPARLRMARIPEGAELIENKVSAAPGFHIGNVFVMAGVPKIMQSMLDAAAPNLKGGEPLKSRSAHGRVREGDVAGPLGALQKENPDVMLGSYPGMDDEGYSVTLVVRSRDEARLNEVHASLEQIIANAALARSNEQP